MGELAVLGLVGMVAIVAIVAIAFGYDGMKECSNCLRIIFRFIKSLTKD